MLGASIYLSQEIDEIEKYLDRLSENNVVEIFTSLHINEENSFNTLDKLMKVSKIIESSCMKLMIDISNNTLKKYNFTLDELIIFLKNIGAKKLRIDFGFSLEEIKRLSLDFEIVLNASTLTNKDIKKLESLGVDFEKITVCHNFYPRVETGIGRDYLLNKNKLFKEKKIKIQAFIPGDENLRGPIYEGLPTLEIHRYKDPLYCYLDLIENYYVDKVFIGDNSIKESTLKRIKMATDGIIPLRLESFNVEDDRIKNILFSIHKNRLDEADFVIRFENTRSLIDFPIEIKNTTNRNKGSITLDNKNYRRYNGEMQITKIDLDKDDRVNVIGKIFDEDINLLDFIYGGVNFKFI